MKTSYLLANKKSFEENSAELVKKCHEQQIKVIPWTVNTVKEIKELIDGIISDYPNLLVH